MVVCIGTLERLTLLRWARMDLAMSMEVAQAIRMLLALTARVIRMLIWAFMQVMLRKRR